MRFKLVNIIYFIAGVLVAFTGFKACESEKAPIILTKDHIIRDSIYIINDSIRTEISYIEKNYDKEVNTIMSNSDSSNLEFFTRYLEDFEQTIKTN